MEQLIGEHNLPPCKIKLNLDEIFARKGDNKINEEENSLEEIKKLLYLVKEERENF